MNYHFIAIGGSAMHNLAIALHKKGETITGSDDEIFEPSRSRLAKFGLLPESEGWFPDKIDKNIDAIVLGMHAKNDNPELLKAKALNIKIYSYPEFLYNQTQNKTRAVIGGSHGKTSTTAMIMHVLNYYKKDFEKNSDDIMELSLSFHFNTAIFIITELDKSVKTWMLCDQLVHDGKDFISHLM
ncbi:MAG: hypothetical protein DRJ10_18030 [Bacteroidetes bacterium]|nr:MAG: hypothetical protein DRJ10_18030 [Bacteroidota bacterium]